MEYVMFKMCNEAPSSKIWQGPKAMIFYPLKAIHILSTGYSSLCIITTDFLLVYLKFSRIIIFSCSEDYCKKQLFLINPIQEIMIINVDKKCIPKIIISYILFHKNKHFWRSNLLHVNIIIIDVYQCQKQLSLILITFEQ